MAFTNFVASRASLCGKAVSSPAFQIVPKCSAARNISKSSGLPVNEAFKGNSIKKSQSLSNGSSAVSLFSSVTMPAASSTERAFPSFSMPLPALNMLNIFSPASQSLGMTYADASMPGLCAPVNLGKGGASLGGAKLIGWTSFVLLVYWGNHVSACSHWKYAERVGSSSN